MSEYVKIAEVQEVPENGMQVFQVEDLEILVLKVEGHFYAFENKCPHMGYPLYFGSLERGVLTCGFHFAKYNVKTGKSVGPVTNKPLKKFKVKIQNSSILVEL